jgi:hypothetical protein
MISRITARCGRGAIALLALALGAVGACNQSTTSGSETNWFGHCGSDADCSVGHCVCDVCTVECGGDSSCPGGEVDRCLPSGSPAFARVCGDMTPAPRGVCVHGCGPEKACPSGYECEGGACVPETPAPALDGGFADAAPTALSMTTFTRPFGDGYVLKFGECFPYSFPVASTGQAACRILTHSNDADCRCDQPGLRMPSPSTLGKLMDYAHAYEFCGVEGAPACELDCFCELTQQSGAGLTACQHGADASSLAPGWCYLDADAGVGDASLVEQCSAASRRMLRMVGNVPDARLYLGCTQVEPAISRPVASSMGELGAPCTPQDEFSPTFPFFNQDELTIDSGSPGCASSVCLVANFRGRTSCPYGQPATETDPSTVDPTLGTEERCYLPGASHDPANEITVPVDPQFVGRPPKDSVYCSCRCDGPADSGPFCTCPGGFACTHLVDERGAGSDTRFAGSYCIKSNTSMALQSTQVVCDRAQRAPRPNGCDDP